MKVFIIILIFFYSFQVKAQYIIAGEHTSHDYYHGFNPDTVLSYDGDLVYPIDVNHDGIDDFKFSFMPYNGAMGIQEWNARIISQNNNKVAIDRIDSCFNDTGKFISKYEIAKPFQFDDTINSTLEWGSSIYLIYTFHMVTTSPIIYCGDIYSLDSAYIGVEVNVGNQIEYGWIKINSIYLGWDTMSFNMGGFACNDFFSGIQNAEEDISQESFFPNPSSEKIYLLSDQKNISDWKIFNTMGNLIFQNETDHQLQNEIDVSNLTNGIYYLHLRKENKIIVRKIVVQR